MFFFPILCFVQFIYKIAILMRYTVIIKYSEQRFCLALAAISIHISLIRLIESSVFKHKLAYIMRFCDYWKHFINSVDLVSLTKSSFGLF